MFTFYPTLLLIGKWPNFGLSAALGKKFPRHQKCFMKMNILLQDLQLWRCMEIPKSLNLTTGRPLFLIQIY